MNLKLILPLKKVTLPISKKEVSIPKLGLKHYKLLKDVKGADENMQILMDSICPGLSPAESDFVQLHILEFNGKIKPSVVKDGITYSLSDVYICQRLEYQYQGNTFKFRAPGKFESFMTVGAMMNSCLLAVNDEKSEVDFMKMPAFTYKWAEEISTTLAIQGPDGTIRGIENIVRLFE